MGPSKSVHDLMECPKRLWCVTRDGTTGDMDNCRLVNLVPVEILPSEVTGNHISLGLLTVWGSKARIEHNKADRLGLGVRNQSVYQRRLLLRRSP